jgi:hypothetical protein
VQGKAHHRILPCSDTPGLCEAARDKPMLLERVEIVLLWRLTSVMFGNARCATSKLQCYCNRANFHLRQNGWTMICVTSDVLVVRCFRLCLDLERRQRRSSGSCKMCPEGLSCVHLGDSLGSSDGGEQT